MFQAWLEESQRDDVPSVWGVIDAHIVGMCDERNAMHSVPLLRV